MLLSWSSPRADGEGHVTPLRERGGRIDGLMASRAERTPLMPPQAAEISAIKRLSAR
jgi:hypothetical protein